MNSEWTKAKISLDKLFELLACGKCKQMPDRPTRFVTCGHFFCDTCIDNDSACVKCKMPVKPKDVQMHHVATQLIYYAKIIMKMITQIDIEGLKPLTKAIDEFCAKQNNIVCDSDADSEEIIEPTQIYKCRGRDEIEERNALDNSARISEETETKEADVEIAGLRNSTPFSQRSIAKDSEPETLGYRNTTVFSQRSNARDSEPETLGYRNSTLFSQRSNAKDSESETLGYRNTTLFSQRSNVTDSEPETVGFRNSTPFSQRKSANDSDTETLGFRDCSPINRCKKRKDLKRKSAGYRNRSLINQNKTETDFQTVNLEYIEPTTINQRLDTMEMESENVLSKEDVPGQEPNKNDTLIPDSDEESENEQNFAKGIVIPETALETQNYHDTMKSNKLAKTPQETMESFEPTKRKKLDLKINPAEPENIDMQTLENIEKDSNVDISNHETYVVTDAAKFYTETIPIQKESQINTKQTEIERRNEVIHGKVNLRLKRQTETASNHDTLTLQTTRMETNDSFEEKHIKTSRINRASTCSTNDHDTLTVATSKIAESTNSPINVPTYERDTETVSNLVETVATESKEENSSSGHLKSIENLHSESVADVSKKVAKEKIVKLKEDRKSLDRQKKTTKLVPKNVNKRNAKGETALHTACVKGQKDFVKSLLEAGANPNTKDNANWTPLQEAVSLGRREICEMLLQSGASVNTPGMDNRTALHEACANDRFEEAALLLQYNGNRNVYDKFGRRPIDYAVSDKMRELLRSQNEGETMPVDSMSLNSLFDQSVVSPHAKLVVLPSNLNTNNSKLLMQLASKIKITVTTSFRPAVTHIIVEANDRNITELSHYVILAILHGKWILNSQWITISTDLNDISEIDLELFEVRGAPNPGTPARARQNEEKQNPRLFNNCFFYFTIGVRGTWRYGKLDFSKDSLATLILAGQGEILKREPDPEDVKDYKLTPFHVAHKPTHPLHGCSHYIIYMPGKDEPRIKYNMPHIKTLPLGWLLECIEKFSLIDPALIGIS